VGFYPTGLDSKMLIGGQPTMSVILEVEADKKVFQRYIIFHCNDMR